MMSRRIQYFITLLLALLQVIQAQKCSICGSDNIRPGNTNTYYNIRYFGTYSCPNLYTLGQQGKIPGYICGIIQSSLYTGCQCGQNPAPSGNGGGSAPFTIPPGLNLPPSFSNNLNLQTPRPTPARPRPTPRPNPAPTRPPTRRPTRPPTRPPTRMPSPRPTPGPTPFPTTQRPTPRPTPKPTRAPTEAPTGRYTRKERSQENQSRNQYRLSRDRRSNLPPGLKELEDIYLLNGNRGSGGGRKLEEQEREPAEMMQEEEQEVVLQEIAELEETTTTTSESS